MAETGLTGHTKLLRSTDLNREALLTVNQLCLERYFQPVFQPVDFSVAAGELLVITGANGSGKTTLIRLLAGILTPSSGSVLNASGQQAYLAHAPAIKDDLSALENLRFVCHFYGQDKSLAQQAIDRTGLSRVAHQPARTLSAGQRKRCALARLLITAAPVWLLDEPYTNLDQSGIELVDQLLLQHLGNGGAAVVATHGEHRPDWQSCQELSLVPGYIH